MNGIERAMETDGTSARTTTPNALLTAARDYAARGWRVVALHSPTPDGGCSCDKINCANVGKHPRWHKTVLPNGLKSATTDPRVITQWWRMWPRANVGIVTGALSGLVVLDVDPRHEGIKSLSALMRRYGSLPDTLEVRTGGGGYHLLFTHPGGDTLLRNAAELDGLPGLDVRGDGGYIVAAPSLHASGAFYEWGNNEPLAALPGWTLQLLSRERGVAPRPYAPLEIATGEAAKEGEHWLDKAIDRAQEGNRNHTAFWLATQLRDNGLAMEQAEAYMLAYADRVPGEDFHPTEAVRAMRSAYREAPRERARAKSQPVPRPPRQKTRNTRTPDLPLSEDEQTRTTASTTPPGDAAEDSANHCTDLGNARRLVRLYGQELRYVAQWASWLVWDGRRWKRDATGEIYRRAKRTVRSIFREAAECEESDDRKNLLKWAMKSEAQARIEAMIACAQTEPEVACSSDQFDADSWLLTCENGTLDLRAGTLRPHRQSDLITKLAPVVYDPNAAAPVWESFLARIMGNNADLIDFLARAIGYSLTGDISEQVLFLLHGAGANGKSKLLEAMEGVVGDYGMQTPTTTLMYKATDNSIPNDVARLKGTRFVKAIETEEGKRLAEALVKQMTGGDMISARFMRAEWFDFKPSFKIWLAANHKPIIRGTDDGIWRRIRFVPFLVQIPEAEQDKHLTEKLQAEYPGILAWAVRGCREWQRIGLETPQEVRAATQDYRAEMDALGAFIDECCVVGARCVVPVGSLYATYETWCDDAGERPISKRLFGIRMVERGFEQKKSSGGLRQWVGIGKKDVL